MAGFLFLGDFMINGFNPIACDAWLDEQPEEKDQDEIDTIDAYLEDQEQARQDDLRNMRESA